MPAITPEQMTLEEEPGWGDSAPNLTYWISEPGGLTQFGAFLQVIPPGSRSSAAHWHSAEDEMIYVLDGTLTLVEGGAETLLRPGDAAVFKAGVPVGHFLENRSERPARCLVVGTRAPVDRITYTDRNLICHRDRAQPHDTFTDYDGNALADPFAG
jgi:uncharacterized cupin superfamily protein